MHIFIDTTFFGHEEIKKNHLSLSTSIFTADILDVWKKSGFYKNCTLIVNYNHEKFFKENYGEFNLLVLKFLPLTLLWKLTGKVATKYLKKLGIFKSAVEKSAKKITKQGEKSLLWIPYSVDYTFIQTSLPTVATIHDIYPVHKKGKSGFEFISDSKVKLTSVSEYTKDDILKTFSLTEDRNISVVPNSIVFDISKQSECKEAGNKNFILDLNAYISKKNPLTLLKAFNLIKDQTDLDLVFCGGYKEDACYNEILTFIKDNSLGNRVKLLFRVSDEERNWLLTHATLFVTPSLFEGFGRTPVEAAICKIPVISTKETSLYEATGSLCNYIEDSMNEKELAELILNILNNHPSEQKLKQISESLKQKYNPDHCAEKYLSIFKEVLC